MSAPELQSLAQMITVRLLSAAAEGMMLAASIWALLRIIGRQNSRTRFAIWFSTLLAIVALPFLAGSSLGSSHLTALAPAQLHREIILSGTWAFYLFIAWAAGAALLLLRVGVGLWQVRQFRSDCSAVDLARLDPAIAAIFREFGSSRRVKLCISDDVATPAAIGFLRPAIVFPAWLLPQLSAEEIELILLHELAHLRRWDLWSNLFQKIVRAVFFFHPAVWWIENRLTLEREMACDDIVLAQSASPRAYASSLILFAERLHNAGSLALAQALVSRMRQTSLRVSQILDAKRPTGTGFWKPFLVAGAGLLALVFGAAPHVPQLVALQSQPSRSQVRQGQTTMQLQAVNETTHPVAVEATVKPRHTVSAPLARAFDAGQQVKAIPAAFNPRNAVLPLRATETLPAGAVAMRARAARKRAFRQPAFVIVETTQFDASGSGISTLCIWRVEGSGPAEREWGPAIVFGSI